MEITPLTNNRYKRLHEIGRGGMGIVYAAYDRLTGDHVALKQVQIEPVSLVFSSRNDASEISLSLAQEFRTLASLRHPNIISVLDYGFDPDRQVLDRLGLPEYYAMEGFVRWNGEAI